MEEKVVTTESSGLFSISDEPATINSFTTILYNKEVTVEIDEINDIPSKPKSTRLCFNCGKDDHNLKDCTKPYNQIRISKNRAKFTSNRGMKLSEFTRYHKEIDDRFSDFRPGKLSGKLKEALGLKKDTLPRYVYNMRKLGYPPGWLEEAKISHSGINMLDSNGERVPDADEEEGEICTVRVKYDASKIIDYPGFNVWPDPGTINETETYGSIPMCYDQSKEAFVARLNDSSYNHEQIIDLEMPFNSEDEMDVGEIDAERFGGDENSKFAFVPPLPEEHEPVPPPPPPEDIPPLPSSDNEVEEPDIKRIKNMIEISSEEEEGELPSRNLVKTLKHKTIPKKNTAVDSSSSTSKDIEEIKTPRTSTSLKRKSDISNETLLTDISGTTVNISTKLLNTSTSSIDTFGRIKSVEFGTPVLNHSPYTSLPSPEKFRKDISDVVYFENLPNSTGKYERLKGVLKTVRTKLNKLRTGGGVDMKK